MIEETEGNNVHHSPSRPYLRRSKTISVAEISASVPNASNDGVHGDSKTAVETPKSSCQALRHAVSALTRIDDFVLEELGSGFFANVYKATHKATNQEMVMKINKDVANRHCSLREVQLMNKMAHPNILRFLGVCVHEGQLHSLTEFISGGNLEELLAQKFEELPWILRIKLSLDIASGLSYVHDLCFIHRDLTSRNVLVKKGENKNYTAIIADFGLATRIPDPNSSNPLIPVGSPWWIAPEVIRAKFYDERADLFSFGIITMEITTRIESDPDVMPRTNNFGVDYHKICELVDYCPLDYLQLAFKCCQVQPERRPSAKLIVSSLEKVYKSLITDSLLHSVKAHKRSKSEDNILQFNDSFSDESVFMTAKGIAHVMSADDPDYSPALVNPFANISQLRYGHKLVDFHHRRLSITSPSHRNEGGMVGTDGGLSTTFVFPEMCKAEALSLPSSPVMLRKAAEKMHQVSLRGSHAVKTESKPDLLLRLSSDESNDSSSQFTSSSSSDRQAQFRSNRTRSLGCLDFFGPGKKHGGGQHLKQPISLQSELTGFCNRSNEILRESSFENILDCDSNVEFNSECEDRTSISEEWDCNQGNCTSLASESYKTAFSYRETGGENTDTSDISLSSCSASSFASVPEIDPVKLTSSTEINKKGLKNISIEEKPIIAIQNGSYERNHFGNSVITNNA